MGSFAWTVKRDDAVVLRASPVWLAVLTAVSCQSPRQEPEPQAALIDVKCAPAVTLPDELRVWAYDDGGVVWYNVRVPDSGSLPSPHGRDLGTILLSPGPINGALRVHVRGLSEGQRVGDGTLSIASLTSGSRRFDLTLDSVAPVDADGDDVPDDIDHCLGFANPDQRTCPVTDAATNSPEVPDAVVPDSRRDDGNTTADGATGAGGQSAAGGSGGSRGTGGTFGGAGSGGNRNTGGTSSTGGVPATGGTLAATGGITAAGGQSSGGAVGAGGMIATGGAITTGGVVASGGIAGAISTGGVTGSGGARATGGASACPAGYVFCDNFESGNASAWTAATTNWAVTTDSTEPVGDEHVYSTNTSSGTTSQAGTMSYADATLETRIKVTRFGSISSANSVGIYLRDNGTNSYALAFGADGTVALRRAAGSSAWQACSTQTSSPSNVAFNPIGASGAVYTSWFKLKLVVSGAPTTGVTITAFVDPNASKGYTRVLQCVQYPGSSPTMLVSGNAGVFAKGSAQAEFDDVLISTP